VDGTLAIALEYANLLDRIKEFITCFLAVAIFVF